MLKKFGKWIVSGKNIVTRGGVYIGTAANVEQALLMASAVHLYDLIDQSTDTSLKQKRDAIMKDLQKN